MRVLSFILGAVLTIGAVAANAEDNKPGPNVKIDIKVKQGQIRGSGVYIGDGIVLTNRHMIPTGVKTVDLIFERSGEEEPIKYVAKPFWTSSEADIAAYKLIHDVDANIAELDCRDPKIGEAIEVVGNPLGYSFIHTWGHVAGVSRTLEDEDMSLAYEVPIDAMIASGNSGGAVYSIDGKVIGLSNMVAQPPAIEIDGDHIVPGNSVGHLDFMVSSMAACEKFGPK